MPSVRPAPILVLALCACTRTPGGGEAAAMHAVAAETAAASASCSASDPFAAERARYEARIAMLEAELDRATTERVEREREWQKYTRGIAQLAELSKQAVPEFAVQVPAEPVASDAAPADPAIAPPSEGDAARERADELLRAARVARDREIFLGLRSLFTVEKVLGLDLLESGALENGATGPVVLRVLDDVGRPIGSLCAARLRLEGSRAARSVTLVLEDGYERLGTDKTPFPGGDDADGEARGGEKRVELAGVDPAPWIEALPELFTKTSDAPSDDGRWNLPRLRTEINLLLREDASAGYWRLADFAGVRGEALLDVVVEELDAHGRRVRTLVADRMSIAAETKGLCLTLESGAQHKGDKQLPFLEGRFRIFLPSADAERWRARGVPGLSQPPADDARPTDAPR